MCSYTRGNPSMTFWTAGGAPEGPPMKGPSCRRVGVRMRRENRRKERDAVPVAKVHGFRQLPLMGLNVFAKLLNLDGKVRAGQMMKIRFP